MAAAAGKAKRVSPPGEAWGYCSRCYVLLSRIIGEKIGGGPQGVRDFAQAELFDPLGMELTLEFDASGTLMGANAMYGSARDWGRFGLLYLADGIASNQRILPEGWVEASVTPTGDTGYGAGFWVNTTDARLEEWNMDWGIPGAPDDAFMARGYMGQYVVIVPSADLVVVRFGQSHGNAAEIESVGQLVSDVITATSPVAGRP
jgi:CubicO group peptidase (beta-lactamase class C family)